MKVICPNGRQRHPRCLRSEIRVYNNWVDLKRAMTQLRKAGNNCTDFLEVNGPALQISRYAPEV